MSGRGSHGDCSAAEDFQLPSVRAGQVEMAGEKVQAIGVGALGGAEPVLQIGWRRRRSRDPPRCWQGVRPSADRQAGSSSSACRCRPRHSRGRPRRPLCRHRWRTLVEGRLFRPRAPRRTAASAALPEDHAPGSGSDLSGTGLHAARRHAQSGLQCAVEAGGRTDDQLPVDLHGGEGQPDIAGGLPPVESRLEIAKALGADEELAVDVGRTAVEDDPDYVRAAATR